MISVDVGGTFIDLVSLDRASAGDDREAASDPERLAEEVVAGFQRLPGTPSGS